MLANLRNASMMDRFICGTSVTSCEETQISILRRVDLNLRGAAVARNLENYSTWG